MAELGEKIACPVSLAWVVGKKKGGETEKKRRNVHHLHYTGEKM